MACVVIRVLVRVEVRVQVRFVDRTQLVGERAIDEGLTRQGWRGHATDGRGLGKGRIHRGDRIRPENQEGNQEKEGEYSVHNE